MEQQLAKRLNRLSESATLKMARISREMKQNGEDIISLSLGEPDFDTPDHIKEAGIQAIREGYTSYPPVPGYSGLRETVVQKIKRDHDLDYSADQVVISTGAKQSLVNILLSLLDQGDEVIVPAPYWVSYPEMIKVAEGTMVNIKTDVEDDYKITPEQLEEAITERTKVFLFCSPSNPTGSVYSQEELERLAKVFERHPHVMIISDEIYDYVNFNNTLNSIARFPGLKARTMIVNGVSKSFAMTGWRIGFMAGPKWMAQACGKIQGQFTSGANTIAQMAAKEAFSGDLTPTHQMRDAFQRRRDLVIDRLQHISGIKYNLPGGAFYLFPDISAYFGTSDGNYTINNSEDFCTYMLEHAKVSLVPGVAFGDDRCIRISFAASDEELSNAMERIREALQRLE